MIEDSICIQLIDARNYVTKVVDKSLNGIKYVEQLVNSILDDENVTPICRHLFGLRIINNGPWLAPNILVQTFATTIRRKRSNNQPKLEIRVRFQPACLKLISIIDKTAFEILFAQVYYDFMTIGLDVEERDFVLLDESVLALVALNLVRHSVENNIDIDLILKRVNPKDFVPKQAPRWQKTLLFSKLIAKPINLQKSLRIAYDRYGNDLYCVKREFIELFLTKVAPDYLTEIHSVHQIVKSDPDPATQILDPVHIRVRYIRPDQEGNSHCLIEKCSHFERNKWDTYHSWKRPSLVGDNWKELCDIETISHVTLHECNVQIVNTQRRPQMFRFNSHWQAKSFVTAIDGYYRLIRKWSFNICREVGSPDLDYLNRLGCHGPIGYETSRLKLAKHKMPGGYIIRRCMEISHRYLIDTLLTPRVMLTIDVDNCPHSWQYTLAGHSASSRRWKLSIKTDRNSYPTLDSLIRSLEIRVDSSTYNLEGSSYGLQLRYKIVPEEGDDYPALMLSRLGKKTGTMQGEDLDKQRLMDWSARMIPHERITYSGYHLPSAGNEFKVQLAKIDGTNQEVVIKSLEADTAKVLGTDQHTLGCAFHYCPKGHGDLEMIRGLRASQVRIADWMFVQSDLFAETIGYIITGCIIQEYFPLGRLDIFLRSQQADISLLVGLYASLQLAQALMFLCEKRIIHGKIRCRNIMVKHAEPLRVKLTDPLGSVDINQDHAFIAPEYFSSSVQPCIRRFYTGIDVWAAGTTIWQIFNHGQSPPPNRFANTLTQTSNCPDKVWSLIESCWTLESNKRVRPATMCRDLFALMAWEKGSHIYDYISDNSSVSCNNSPNERTPPDSTSADFSSLRTNNSSNINSPNSVSANGSQTNLLAQRTTTNGTARSSSSRQYIGAHAGWPTSTNTMSGYMAPLIRRPQWAKISKLKQSVKKGCQIRGDELGSPKHIEFCDIFGSSLSLDSSSNNCTTETTDVLDLQSISDAFDRCVWHVDSNRLKLGAEIGRGSSGVVIKGIMTQSDGQDQVVAVKSIQRTSSIPVDSSRIEDLKREFDILKNLDHKNIVKTLGYNHESHMLIFEYMPLGSLLSCIRNVPRHEDLAAMPLQKYGLDIAYGMEYLESVRIVHRDLALRNILLKSLTEVKICDFGLAQALGTDDHYKIETDRALPLKWYSPETLTSWVFTSKSDVWSYGVVLWELYSGGDSPNYPGTYADLPETLKHERLSLPKNCPRNMYDMMLSCWMYDPEKRMSFKQICRDLEAIYEQAPTSIPN